MRRTWLLASLGVLACAHAPAPAPEPGPVTRAPADRAVVEMLLAAKSEPASSDWEGLGPGAATLLSDAARDAKRPAEQRTRAVRALGSVAAPDADGALSNLLHDGKLTAPVRTVVVESLASREGRGAASLLVDGLTDPSVEVRGVTARALGALGGTVARRALTERLDKETDPGVREVLLESLSRAQP